MKKKSLIIFIVLTLFFGLSLFTLTGCGETSLKTIGENFEKLDVVYQQNNVVFTTGECSDLQTDCLINYGDDINLLVSSGIDGYIQLRDVYNTCLAISNDYIKSNRNYILNLDETKLTKIQKSALTKLNASLVDYTNSIDSFLKARSDYLQWYERFGADADESLKDTHLRGFKKEYGNLVEKNIQLALDVAKTIEEVDIFTMLQDTTPTNNDAVIIKNYIKIKLLPIYSNFIISEIENNLNWEITQAGEFKNRIDTILTNLNDLFVNYKNNFVSNNTVQTLTATQTKNIISYTQDFFVEAEGYFVALEGLDIKTLANPHSYNNDLEKYKQSNTLAEVYLNKIEEFIQEIAPNYLEKVAMILF